jgi:phospholipid-binding lipoprotein MlaA
MTVTSRFHVFVALLCLALCAAGCAAKTVALQPEIPARHTVAEFADDEPVIGVSDPWEGFNRGMYRFNYNMDRYVFLPVVHVYETCTATFLQKGVSNFFSNLGEIGTLYNSVFQGKGRKAATTIGRFLANSTIGIGGLFDPATYMGLKKQSEDFGRTLGTWGVPTGPYLVLPAFGPGTVRGAAGFAMDAGILYGIGTVADPFRNVSERPALIAGISTLQGINMRHMIKFYYYESGSPFEYTLVRYLYYKKGELSLLK